MRISMPKGFAALCAAGVLVALAFAPGSVFADWFVGFDKNGDNDCEAADFDRGRFYPGVEVGTIDSFVIFFDGSIPIFNVGCVFCVTVDSLVGNYSFTYSAPSGWTAVPIADEESGSIRLSSSLIAAYPAHECWLINATDFSGSNVFSAYPLRIGTFSYQVAHEGQIEFIFDAGGDGDPMVGVLTQNYSSYQFTAEEACRYAMTATESHSWGAVKQLFR